MSCFLVNPYHIGLLAEYASKHKCLLIGTATRASNIARIFHEANVRSVHMQREGEEEDYPPYHHNPAWARDVERFEPVEIIKAIECLQYNCSLAEDWEESAAYFALGQIKNTAIRLLPGYSDAPWELRSEE